jgi:hypothetical protein
MKKNGIYARRTKKKKRLSRNQRKMRFVISILSLNIKDYESASSVALSIPDIVWCIASRCTNLRALSCVSTTWNNVCSRLLFERIDKIHSGSDCEFVDDRTYHRYHLALTRIGVVIYDITKFKESMYLSNIFSLIRKSCEHQ